MLDAAHGEAVGPVVVIQRVHATCVAEETACMEVARGVGRRGPPVAVRADVSQGSRRVDAVARSRPKRNRWIGCTEETQRLRCRLEWTTGFLAAVIRPSQWIAESVAALTRTVVRTTRGREPFLLRIFYSVPNIVKKDHKTAVDAGRSARKGPMPGSRCSVGSRCPRSF